MNPAYYGTYGMTGRTVTECRLKPDVLIQELNREPSPTTRKGRLRGVPAVPKMLPSVSERFPLAKLRHFGVFRLFRGFNCGISDEKFAHAFRKPVGLPYL